MIRRISKHNDLKDIIKSCPSGVIDDIYAIEYYIQGYNTVIQANFTKTGEVLEVVLPSTDLETLPNGILMRRAYYKVLDASYPDGYYNLQFEDNMNIWLGDVESEEPVIPDYVTEEELSSTLSSYATQDWVSSQQFLTSENLPSGIATQSWVRSYTYDSSTIDYACGKAEDNAITWVQEQGYLTASTIPSDIATQSWVSSYFYTKSYIDEVEINNDLRMKAIEVSLDESYATMSWVLSQSYITVGDLPSGLATQSWVESYTYDKSTIEAFAGKAQGDALYEAQEWVRSYTYDKSTIEAFAGKARVDALSDAQEWVSSQQFATQSWVQSQGYLTSHQDLSSYATQSWVQSQGYLTYSSMASYATKAWVSSQQFATQSWVQGQGYYTSSSTIPASIIGDNLESRVHDIEIGATEIPGYVTNEVIGSYATKSWVSSNFFEESKIWVGTMIDWLSLTSEQRSSYTIALIKE